MRESKLKTKMDISEIRKNDTVVLHLSGYAGGVEFIQFCKRAEGYKGKKFSRLIVDLHEVTFLDSSAIGGFIYLSKTLKKSGVAFTLSAPNEQIRDLFRQCSLDGVVRIEHNPVEEV